MRFLADECCDYAAVRALRSKGHDVLAVGESQQRSIDPDLMALALREDRILLTEDKDFGWLVFAARLNSPGVIRFPATSRAALADAVTRLVHEHANALAGAFVVLQPGLARFSPHLNLIKSPHSAVPSNRQGVAPATNTRNPNE